MVFNLGKGEGKEVLFDILPHNYPSFFSRMSLWKLNKSESTNSTNGGTLRDSLRRVLSRNETRKMSNFEMVPAEKPNLNSMPATNSEPSSPQQRPSPLRKSSSSSLPPQQSRAPSDSDPSHPPPTHPTVDPLPPLTLPQIMSGSEASASPSPNPYQNGSSHGNGTMTPNGHNGLNGANAPNAVRKKLMGYVGFANLPNQVHRKSVRKGFQFTAMVVGKSLYRFLFHIRVFFLLNKEKWQPSRFTPSYGYPHPSPRWNHNRHYSELIL